MEQKSARISPSPSASVDLPHLSRRPAGVCAFCRISLEPEAEGDFRPPLLDRAGADVNVIRSTIYSGSSVPTNVARKERRQEKGIRRMPPLRVTAIHDGVVAVAGVGVILRSRHVHRQTGSTKPLLRTDSFQCLHISHLTSHIANAFGLSIISLRPGRERSGQAPGHPSPDDSVGRFAIRRP
jgi:hypothetical protein